MPFETARIQLPSKSFFMSIRSFPNFRILTKRGIGNDKVVHPFGYIRMPLVFAMLSKRLPCDGQPFRRKKSVSASENVFPSSPADAHVYSAIRASCKAARLYSGMAFRHWKRSDITSLYPSKATDSRENPCCIRWAKNTCSPQV